MAYIANGWAAVAGAIPLYLALGISTVICYYCYTFHHESTHGNISGRANSLEKIIGNISSVIIDLHFSGYSRMHMKHHQHTNTKLDSLDSQFRNGYKSINRSFKTIAVKVLTCIPFGLKIFATLVSKEVKVKTYIMLKQKDMVRFNRINFAIMCILLLTPFRWVVLCVWYLPATLYIFLHQFLTDWLPHAVYSPNNQRYTDEYRNTRILTWPGSSIMMAGQDYHLIHHLYPRIPFHKYRKAFRLMEQSLIKNGAIIQSLPRARASRNK